MAEDIHKNHKDKEKEEQTVLDFYNEHDQFVLLLVHMNERQQVEITFEYPRCYECGCKHQYKDEELKEIAKRLRVSATLEKEITQLNSYKEKIEPMISKNRDTVPIKSQDKSNISEDKNKVHEIKEQAVQRKPHREEVTKKFFSEMNLIQVIGFSYLYLIITKYKDYNKMLEIIKQNAKIKLNLELNDLEKIKDIEGLKHYFKAGNSFLDILYKIPQTYTRVASEMKGINSTIGKIYLGHFANELRVRIDLSSAIESTQIFFPKEPKYNIFPDLTSDNNIELEYEAPFKLYALLGENNKHPKECNHLNSKHKFNKDDTMFTHKLCTTCKSIISKKDLITYNITICIICLNNFALKENRVELFCGHKICISCYNTYEGKTLAGNVYCVVCQSLRNSLFHYRGEFL